MGGEHTLVQPLGGLVACSPRKFFVNIIEYGLEGKSHKNRETPNHTVCYRAKESLHW